MARVLPRATGGHVFPGLTPAVLPRSGSQDFGGRRSPAWSLR